MQLVVIVGLSVLILLLLLVLVLGVYHNAREAFMGWAARRRLLREVGAQLGAASRRGGQVRGLHRGWPVRVAFRLRLDTGQGGSLEWTTLSMPLPEGRPLALRLVCRPGREQRADQPLGRWEFDGAPAPLVEELVTAHGEALDALGIVELTTSGEVLELHLAGWRHHAPQVRAALDALANLLEDLEQAYRALDREAGLEVEGAAYRDGRFAAQERLRAELALEVQRTQRALRRRALARLAIGAAATAVVVSWYLFFATR